MKNKLIRAVTIRRVISTHDASATTGNTPSASCWEYTIPGWVVYDETFHSEEEVVKQKRIDTIVDTIKRSKADEKASY
jgi:hypothetical protein